MCHEVRGVRLPREELGVVKLLPDHHLEHRENESAIRPRHHRDPVRGSECGIRLPGVHEDHLRASVLRFHEPVRDPHRAVDRAADEHDHGRVIVIRVDLILSLILLSERENPAGVPRCVAGCLVPDLIDRPKRKGRPLLNAGERSGSDSMDDSFSTGVLSSSCEPVISLSVFTGERFSADTIAVSKDKKHIDRIKSQLHIIFKYLFHLFCFILNLSLSSFLILVK